MPPGQYPQAMQTHEEMEQQIMASRSHLLSTCKRLRNCLLVSWFAGSWSPCWQRHEASTCMPLTPEAAPVCPFPFAQTMSRLAGLEEDGHALANLNPGDLMMLDTDNLCHKFSSAIMQRMTGGRLG